MFSLSLMLSTGLALAALAGRDITLRGMRDTGVDVEEYDYR